MDHTDIWATKLKKMQRQARQTALPLDIQRQRLQEELDYFKARLERVVIEHDRVKANQYVEKLIHTRARLFGIQALEYTAEHGETMPADIMTQAIQAYYQECTEMVQAVEAHCS